MYTQCSCGSDPEDEGTVGAMKFSKHADLTPAEQIELNRLIKRIKQMLNSQPIIVISIIEDIEDSLQRIRRRIYWSQS